MGKTNHVMIVEDECIVYMITKRRLRNLGYETNPNCIPTGEEAIRYYIRHKPDIVLMDINLKGDIDGAETAKEIKKMSEVPVIYTTALSSDDAMKMVRLTEKPWDIVFKPFDPKELKGKIEIFLGTLNGAS